MKRLRTRLDTNAMNLHPLHAKAATVEHTPQYDKGVLKQNRCAPINLGTVYLDTVNLYADKAPKFPGSAASRTVRRVANWRYIIPLLCATLLIAACDFGQQEPTPTPFAAATYQPGLEGLTDEAATAATPQPDATAPDSLLPGDADQDDAQAEGQPATGAAQITLPVRTATGSYSGEIVADREVSVMSEVSGMALAVPIDVGQQVSAGDLLVRVDSSMLEAQRAQALASLEAAQAQRDLLNDTANDSEIEAARAAVAAADAAYKRTLDGPTSEDITIAESQLRQAEAAVDRAQAAYDQVAWSPVIGALPESLQLEQATLQLEAAQAQYDQLLIGATPDMVANAYAQLAQARAQLERVQEGPADAQVQAAEAQVRQAEAALYLAQLQLDKTTIRAPIDGVILNVNTTTGTMLSPGAPVATIMSSEVNVLIRVEENRLAALEIDQEAEIRVNAHPGQIFNGAVTIIAPTLDPATRTVQVTIRPDDTEGLLAPGMFAAVDLLSP